MKKMKSYLLPRFHGPDQTGREPWFPACLAHTLCAALALPGSPYRVVAQVPSDWFGRLFSQVWLTASLAPVFRFLSLAGVYRFARIPGRPYQSRTVRSSGRPAFVSRSGNVSSSSGGAGRPEPRTSCYISRAFPRRVLSLFSQRKVFDLTLENPHGS